MAKTKITALTELTDTNIAIGDLIPIVDISDTSQAASGTTKKVTITSLATAVASAFSGDSPTFVNLTTTGTTTLGDSGDATTVNGTLNIKTANAARFYRSDDADYYDIGAYTGGVQLNSIVKIQSAGGVNAIFPTTNNATDLGTSALAFKDGYLSGTLGVTGNLTVDTDTLFVDAATDCVGIGTVSPNEKLDVQGAGLTTLKITNTNVTSPSWVGMTTANFEISLNRNPTSGVMVDSTKPGGIMDLLGSTGDFVYNGVTSGGTVSERMRILSTGNVGIGVSTGLSHILHISGAGRSTQSAWDTTSDERTKTNIELADLQKCYDVVKSLALKRFTYKDEIFTDKQIKDRTQLGWIAQEVKQVFPKAVNESDLTYNQKYENVIIPAIDEVKDEDGNITIQAQAERTEKKLISEDKIENCLNLNVGQIYSSMYGAIQMLIQKVEALESK